MNKLINIAKRLSRSVTSKDAQQVYDTIRNDRVLSQMILPLSANNFLLLCFLIAAENKKMNLEGTVEQFNKFLLSFVMVEIFNTTPEETCDSCGGNGEESCNNCGGSGRITCDECNGSGEDEEGDTCNYCDGDGEMDCDDCGGNGNETCYNCDGSGSVDDNYKVEVNVYECITISNHIFNVVESQELEIPMEYDKFDLVMSDRETIKLYSYGVTTDNFDTDLKGEVMIVETNKTDILLGKQSNGFIRDNFLNDID
jgi:hypothetical protein